MLSRTWWILFHTKMKKYVTIKNSIDYINTTPMIYQGISLLIHNINPTICLTKPILGSNYNIVKYIAHLFPIVTNLSANKQRFKLSYFHLDTDFQFMLHCSRHGIPHLSIVLLTSSQPWIFDVAPLHFLKLWGRWVVNCSAYIVFVALIKIFFINNDV